MVTSGYFHREAAGIEPANGVRIHVAGVDLICDESALMAGLTDATMSRDEGWLFLVLGRLGLLRTMGVPARYVSRYLHPAPDAPVVGRRVGGVRPDQRHLSRPVEHCGRRWR